MQSKSAVVRGGGDLATGIIYRLWRTNFRVICLETEHPFAIRREVSVAQAVFNGAHEIEGMMAVKISSISEWHKNNQNIVSVLIDPKAESIALIKPDIVIDATMQRRYTGTNKDMAPLVLAIGPGFSAPEQVHGVIETNRGHYLGRLITNGAAMPNTGIPAMEMGYTTERLLRAPADGYVESLYQIGDHVAAGQTVATMEEFEIKAQISGILRGIVHPSARVKVGMKIGDIDPRNIREHCYSITDKALAIAGGALEAIMRHENNFC